MVSISGLAWRCLAAVLGVMWTSGCAIGNIGTIGAHVKNISGGQVVDVHMVGLYLRTRSDDAGAGLGYARRRYVFGNTNSLVPGWHFFYVTLPSSEAVALDGLSIGVDFSAVEPVSGVTVGYSHIWLRARVLENSSIYLEYDDSASNIIKYIRCEENKKCDPF